MPRTINPVFVLHKGDEQLNFSALCDKLYAVSKRAVDIFIGILGLTLSAPCIGVFAVLMKCTSPGPVFFHQERGGINGRPFTIYKLRTFHAHLCDEGLKQVTVKDPRVSAFGVWLRKRSLDELPQFWNILRGDMSLIGPRPHTVGMDQHYSSFIPNYYERYRVKPGLTGLAQLEGCRGETKQIAQMQERIDFDIRYIEEQSIRLDIVIFIKSAYLFIRALC